MTRVIKWIADVNLDKAEEIYSALDTFFKDQKTIKFVVDSCRVSLTKTEIEIEFPEDKYAVAASILVNVVSDTNAPALKSILETVALTELNATGELLYILSKMKEENALLAEENQMLQKKCHNLGLLLNEKEEELSNLNAKLRSYEKTDTKVIEEMLISYFKDNPKATVSDFANKHGLSIQQISKIVDDLKSRRIIVNIDNTYYTKSSKTLSYKLTSTFDSLKNRIVSLVKKLIHNKEE